MLEKRFVNDEIEGETKTKTPYSLHYHDRTEVGARRKIEFRVVSIIVEAPDGLARCYLTLWIFMRVYVLSVISLSCWFSFVSNIL